VTVAPAGAGRLIVSGALDAWRYRADDSAAFDRFWQAAIGGLALASVPAIDVDVQPAVVAPGADVHVSVRVRRSALGMGNSDALRVSGRIADADTPIRFLPDSTPDSFHASFAAPVRPGATRVLVTAANQVTAASLVVAAGARTATPDGPPLALLADSHGGVNVTAERIGDLVQRLRTDIAAPTIRVERRPMRSIWWIAPFAACLTVEWWLRRRRGLR
jgi:hypothetical protein